MTGEEMERAIEFLLQSQANFDARLEQTNQQLAETNRQITETNRQLAETNSQLAETSRQLQGYAETQTEFIQIVTRHIEAQAVLNSSFRDSVRELTAAQLRTDERLGRLADTVERFITEGRNGNSQQ